MKVKRKARSTTTALDRCCNVADFEAIAKRRMPPAYYHYYAGGAEDERTLARNRDAFDHYPLMPRVLVDVSRVDTATRVLGANVSMPILLAPAAYHQMAHRDGESATARAAGAEGALMVASTMATRSLESIAEAATGPLWFQLYVFRDRSIAEWLVGRAEQAGYRALVLTVDTPRLGRRERDATRPFVLPRGAKIRNFEGRDDLVRWDAHGHMASYAAQMLDASLDWSAVAWLRARTSLPIVLKGIMRPDDAVRAVEAGAAAVWVSNHGGRQLDGEQATLHALTGVAEAVGGRAEIYVDGGFRRGTDVLKALALGAHAVCVGRPYLWGLAAGGELGVRRVLSLLRAELEGGMALLGTPSLAEIDRSCVAIG